MRGVSEREVCEEVRIVKGDRAMDNSHIPYCPFYRKDGTDKLYCEGGTIKFPDREARHEIVYNVCASAENHKNCTVYKMLMNHYDRKYRT